MERDATRVVRSRTPRIETDLNIFGITYSSLINLDVYQHSFIAS
jgi:hypothetical protein